MTSGGLRQTFPYGLKFDYFGTIEGEKLLGWEGLFVNLHGESRFGQSVNRDVGSLVPANFALEFPKPAGSASALTNVQIEQFLGPDFVVTFGKLNAADGVNIHPFLGGNGINRFMNEAFVLSPLYGRLIPYSTPGAGFSYLRDFDPVFTFLVLDHERPARYQRGQSYVQQRRNPLRFASRARDAVRLARSPIAGSGLCQRQVQSALSPDDYIILPGIPAQRRTGSWLVTYGFDQFLFIDPDDPTKGWGIFANISLADQTTNPVHWFLNLGVGGDQPVARTLGRLVGRWPITTWRPAASSGRPSGPSRRARNEQGFELYYNAAITSWFTLSADIQAIDPAQVDARSAFLFGLRAKIDF